MFSDIDWSPNFCLACDKQTDGGVYCGEACRLAEYEKANSSSVSSSPVSRPANNFHLPPAFDFTSYRASLAPTTTTRPKSSPAMISSRPVLTPSSSASSLVSMRSSSSTYEPVQLSEEDHRQLRAYASLFDQSRYHRRQSA